MSCHFVMYRRISDSKPVDCAPNQGAVDRRLAASPDPLFVTRLLTGNCPICGRSISRLSGVRDPLPSGYDREFQS